MPRTDLKTRTHYGTTIKTELLNQLKEISEQTGIPMSKLLDQAIQLRIDQFKSSSP